jgi:hypothetical protein
MGKPTDYPDWYPTGADANTIEPSSGKKNAGFAALEKIAYQFLNWLFYSISAWIRYLDTVTGYDVVVAASGYGATHATLAAAISAVGSTPNLRVLLADSQSIAPVTANVVGWRMYALSGVTYTKASGTTGITMAGAGTSLEGLRMAGYTTAGDKAITCTSAWTFGRVFNCNFAPSTDTDIDDSNAPAGKKPEVYGNILEV